MSNAYLRDFLFSDERARSPVKALSGGERNRLLLARTVHPPGQRARARRADQRPRSRDARAARGAARRVAGDAVAGQPRPAPSSTTSSPARSSSTVMASSRNMSAATRTGSGSGWPRRAHALPTPGSPARRPRCRRASRSRSRRRRRSRRGARSCRSRNSGSSTSCRRRYSNGSRRSSRALAERIAAPEFYKEGAEAIKQALARAEALPPELAKVYARWAELDARKS